MASHTRDAKKQDPRLDKIVLLVVSLQDREKVAAACIERLQIPPAEVPGLIERAIDRIIAAGRTTPERSLGEALIRLEDLYERALRVQDTKTALACQREISKLQNHYKRRPATAGATIRTEKQK